MKKEMCLILAFSALAASAFAQTSPSPKPMQQAKKFERTVTNTLRSDYLLFLPQGYEPKGEKKWPLILFLHGSGERGTDVQKVGVHGPPKIVKNKPEFPFIVVSPQCPENQWWSQDVLLALLDNVIATYNVDTNRIYLTGLSMGGFGAWTLGVNHPERFAAIAPICGGGQVIDVYVSQEGKSGDALKSLGVWAFHGAKDPVVNPEESERMVKALQSYGCKDVKLTVYPEAQHDSWTQTYDNPELYDWFLKHTRAKSQ